jgi:hypothetical protein
MRRARDKVYHLNIRDTNYFDSIEAKTGLDADGNFNSPKKTLILPTRIRKLPFSAFCRNVQNLFDLRKIFLFLFVVAINLNFKKP